MKVTFSLAAAAALLLAGLTGCASEGPPPREELAKAHALVGQADKGNAQRYAAADLQRAHDEVTRADAEFEAHKYNEARADAESAAADADLANARAGAGEAQQAAAQIVRDQSAISREAERAADASAAAPPPPPPPPTPQ